MTKSISDKIRSCAEILKDHVLIAKLAQSMNDLIAFGAQYHPECLITIYKQASHVQTSPVQLDSEVLQVRVNSESLAFANVVSYMEDVRQDESTPTVFRLSTLVDLYLEQLKLHGFQVENRVQSTRFKDRLLQNCRDLTAVMHGRDVLLTYNDHLGTTLKLSTSNADTDAIHLMHTAKIIRN